ncbi:AAA family ATPase [Kribbella sp. NPDC051952]|uniref:helix-turn-helix transcriptional regulator n=1 Tax=Kribbella sp. NPDC051952 TaxID=3154851 RepID=UPI0034158AD1
MTGGTAQNGGSLEQAPTISSPGFTGRDRELAAFQEALGRPPALVLIEGEAGIGKSRLLHETLPETSVIAACPPFRAPYTLGPVVDALRQVTDDVGRLGLSALAGVLRPLFPEWNADLPPLPDPAEDATAARHRLFRAIAEVLERLELSVLVLEDLHWADEATLEFLLYLVSQQSAALSLVLTYRPEDVAADSLLLRLSSRAARGWTQARITLSPLDVAETAAFVSSMVGGERISGEFASFLHERTGGVPLVVEELVRLMHDRADLYHRGGSWVRRHLVDIDVPPTVRDAVLERAGQLDEDARAVLRAAAVASAPTGEDTLETVAGLPPRRWTAALTAALGSRLLQEDEGRLVSFRHVLACRAVYDAIPGPERRALHLVAGQMLEPLSPQPVTQLARHYREAGQIANWSQYAEAAADLALASGDEATATTLLHDLVANAELPASTLVRLAGKIPFSSFTGDDRFGDLVRALRSVLESATLDRAEQGEVRLQLGRVLLLMDEHELARAEIERAIPDLAHTPVVAARAMTLLGWPRGTSWPSTRHQHWLNRAAATITAEMPPAERAKLAVDRVTGLLMLGSEAGWAEADHIRADEETARERRCFTLFHLNVGDMAIMWGRYDEARQRLGQALELAERYQYGRFRDMILVTTGTLDWFTGAWTGLAERVDELAADRDIQTGNRLESLMVRGLLHSATGDLGPARDVLQTVLGETRRRGAVSTSMTPAAGLARLALIEGDVEAALAVTAEPIDVMTRKHIWVWAADLAPARVQALVTAGRFDEAARTVESFAHGLGTRHAPAPVAALVVCRAMLAEGRGNYPLAASLFHRASTAWRSLPRPYEAALTRQRAARCLLAIEDESALPALVETYQELSDLGATHAAGIVQRDLREHGVVARRPARGGRPSYGDQLSPRELDVVALVIDGLTNRQIAAALVVSVQTVASHLHSAMRKLQVSSRTALAVAVVERDEVLDRRGTTDRKR